MTANLRKSFESIIAIFGIEAPITFLIPISFVLCSVVYLERPTIPRQDIIMHIIDKLAKPGYLTKPGISLRITYTNRINSFRIDHTKCSGVLSHAKIRFYIPDEPSAFGYLILWIFIGHSFFNKCPFK